MSLVLGIDPGATGAFALYDTDARSIISIDDMPLWFQVTSARSKRKRKRVDALALADLFDTYELLSVDLMCMEAVGGRTGQSASAGFNFGYGVGLIYMSAIYSRIPIETVPPMTWKRMMKIPGKDKADPTAIVQRANELFPEARAEFRGPKGGLRVDRAEAAIIARFAADHVLRTMPGLEDPSLRARTMRADTGA